VPRCERLLDLGCGRGRELFVERAQQAVGFDVSLRFIRDCSSRYDVVAQGSLPRLPFRPAIFDVVVSSHLLGHILPQDKDELVAEIGRVLRPGGLTAHVIETNSEHAMVQAAKMTPEAYRRQFVEQDGHVGLETAGTVLRRFEAQGFRLRTLLLVDAIIPSLQNFRKYFDHPGLADVPRAGLLRRLDRLTASSPLFNLAYEISMGVFHRSLEQRLGKPNDAQFILVAFDKDGDRRMFAVEHRIDAVEKSGEMRSRTRGKRS
jgi:SAM-dependent methyltransferase